MRFMSHIAAATLVLALAASSHAAGTADPYAAAREEFQQAYARAAKTDSDAADSERLKNYPLYPYLQAERLRKALAPDSSAAGDADQRASAFVATYDRLPVVR